MQKLIVPQTDAVGNTQIAFDVALKHLGIPVGRVCPIGTGFSDKCTIYLKSNSWKCRTCVETKYLMSDLVREFCSVL